MPDDRTHEAPLYIVGAARSGTTLLSTMVHAHPQAAVIPETHFFANYVAPALRPDGSAPEVSQVELSRICDLDRFLNRVAVTAEALLSPFGGGSASWIDVYRQLLAGYTRNLDGACRVVEKDNRLTVLLPQLWRLLPKASVVHVIRDPRDVVLSLRKVVWGRKRTLRTHIQWYRQPVEAARAAGPELFGDRYVEVFYEDLLAQPEQTLRRMCDGVGLPFDPTMLAHTSAAKQIVASDEMAWKANVFRPLMTNNSGKWRGQLNRVDALLIESACRSVFAGAPFEEDRAAPRLLSALIGGAADMAGAWRSRLGSAGRW